MLSANVNGNMEQVSRMINLPQYTKKDRWIFLSVCVPHVIFLNILLFGKRYFTDITVFVAATMFTFIIMASSWHLHTWVAVTLRNRFSKDSDLVKRMAIAVVLFILMTGIIVTMIFYGYNYFHFLNYEFDEKVYDWALATGMLLNIFTTVIYESVYSFEKWKTTLTENEQLKKEHMHSRLLGLRSQVSPHFLFNSLNSLSSLINDDPARAEIFLDEMSKVYRYLLRHNEEQIVELGTELTFVRSYYHLLKARYGKGVELVIEVDEKYYKNLLPPLTLQILLDNALKVNLISKEKPLSIYIYVKESGWLEIKNNIQKRIAESAIPDDSGIANISTRFRLQSHQSINITENDNFRKIKVPLMSSKQTVGHESI